jgi:hypothetical protein
MPRLVISAYRRFCEYLMTVPPKLKPLHGEHSLINLKLQIFCKLATEVLIDTLKPGQTGSLKVRPDGTMVDGHHRIKVLRDRGVEVDLLPREIIPKS